MMVVILGGVALQWPIGHLSDRFDRRRVIVGGFAATLGVSAALAIQPSGALLFALGFAFGGLGFALYPLCVAHVNDRLLSSARSEEHTSELQSLMRILYAVLCLKTKTK